MWANRLRECCRQEEPAFGRSARNPHNDAFGRSAPMFSLYQRFSDGHGRGRHVPTAARAVTQARTRLRPWLRSRPGRARRRRSRDHTSSRLQLLARLRRAAGHDRLHPCRFRGSPRVNTCARNRGTRGTRRGRTAGTGAEYITASVLETLWSQIAAAFRSELAESKVAVQDFLQRKNPAWHLVGRVHFNLAEDRRPDPPSNSRASGPSRG